MYIIIVHMRMHGHIYFGSMFLICTRRIYTCSNGPVAFCTTHEWSSLEFETLGILYVHVLNILIDLASVDEERAWIE